MDRSMRSRFAGILVAGLLVSACSASSASVAPSSPASAAPSAAASTAPSAVAAASPSAPASAPASTGPRGPITLDQCSGEKKDRTVTYDKVPEHVFVLDPQSAEFLIAMGLGDKIVGSWGMYGDETLAKVIPQYAAELKKIKVIGDDKTWPPPVEQIASTKPDFVLTTYRLNMPGYLDATRLEADLGIKSYTFLANCTGGVDRTLDPLFADIVNIGAIFDVPDAATKLIDGMKADLAKAAALTAGMARPTIWEYAGEDIPYPVGGTGIPNAVIYLAGGLNSFEDVNEVYGEVSWEQVTKRNPDVIWIQTSAGPGFVEAEDGIKKATESNPGLASVTGVAKKAYVVVPYTTGGTLSVHNAEAVLEFAQKLQTAMGK
ncbi:MAG: ABC transporter substrate-binding protein [Chloroflexota bacterium]